MPPEREQFEKGGCQIERKNQYRCRHSYKFMIIEIHTMRRSQRSRSRRAKRACTMRATLVWPASDRERSWRVETC
jgi:hypothetical protein